MTSKLTREQLHERARENVKALKMASRQTAFQSAREEILADLQLAELALAAMDSEPVALQPELAKVIYHFRDLNEGFPVERFKADYVISWMLANYPPAPPAPVVQPVMFIDGDISTEDVDKLAKVIRDFNEEDERPLAKMARIIRENPHPTNECDMPKAQPAPVVPDDVLGALQKVARIRLDMNDFDGDRRGIADCLCDAEEALIEVVNRRAAMLAAARQSPGSEPATMPGKWIPVSEQKPDCWCLTCRPVVLNDMRFVVCPDCGNKRCPRANDHRNACTGSNEPGQEGGAYPDTPQEVKP